MLRTQNLVFQIPEPFLVQIASIHRENKTGGCNRGRFVCQPIFKASSFSTRSHGNRKHSKWSSCSACNSDPTKGNTRTRFWCGKCTQKVIFHTHHRSNVDGSGGTARLHSLHRSRDLNVFALSEYSSHGCCPFYWDCFYRCHNDKEVKNKQPWQRPAPNLGILPLLLKAERYTTCACVRVNEREGVRAKSGGDHEPVYYLICINLSSRVPLISTSDNGNFHCLGMVIFNGITERNN